jgi:hypothetical protein
MGSSKWKQHCVVEISKCCDAFSSVKFDASGERIVVTLFIGGSESSVKIFAFEDGERVYCE